MTVKIYTSRFFYEGEKLLLSIKSDIGEPIFKIEQIHGQFKIKETKWVTSCIDSKFGKLSVKSGNFTVNLFPYDLSSSPIYSTLFEIYQHATSVDSLPTLLGKFINIHKNFIDRTLSN